MLSRRHHLFLRLFAKKPEVVSSKYKVLGCFLRLISRQNEIFLMESSGIVDLLQSISRCEASRHKPDDT